MKRILYVSSVSVDRDFPHTLRVRIVEHKPAMYVLSEGRWFVVADDGFVICETGKAKDESRGDAVEPAAADAEQAGAAAGSAGASPAPTTSTTSAADSADDGAGQPAGSSAGKAAALAEALALGPANARRELPRAAVADPVKTGAIIDDAGVRSALPVVAGLPGGLRRHVAVVQASANGTLTLRFDDGLRVTWGDTQRSLAKSLALAAVLDRYDAAGKACTFADVSIPDTTLARPILK